MTEFFLYESVIVLLKYRSGSSFWFVVCLFKQGPTPLNRETDRPTSFIIVYGSVIYFSLTSLIKSFVRNLISFVCVNASSRTHTHTPRGAWIFVKRHLYWLRSTGTTICSLLPPLLNPKICFDFRHRGVQLSTPHCGRFDTIRKIFPLFTARKPCSTWLPHLLPVIKLIVIQVRFSFINS